LVGGKVVDIKLIPSFWEGQFAVAWVTTAGLGQSWPVMTGAPYVIDVACIIVSSVMLRRRLSRNALVAGLLLMLMCLRPTFDLFCETIGFVGGFHGDLWHMQLVIGSAALWSFLLVSLALCLLSVVVILRRYGGFPEPLPAIRLASLTAATANLRAAAETAPGRRGAAPPALARPIRHFPDETERDSGTRQLRWRM
jgi:hypothetical protein